METTTVEAASLSTLQHMAINPPAHPNAPAHVPTLPPLVLYIARVPGSRDVFLTPIKPRKKVVTAEDVQSSLYFIHVNDAADLEQPPVRPSSVNTDASHLLPLHGAPPIVARLPPAPPKHATFGRVRRKPVGSKSAVSHHGEPDLPTLPRRPLPPLPQDEQNNPYLRPYESLPPPVNPVNLSEPGSLTLIRRNPASSEQWNVAFIHHPPIQEISSAALRNPSAAPRTKCGGLPLFLDISNPGYARFINDERTPARQSVDAAGSNCSAPPPHGVFRRRLYMPGSQYGEHSYSRGRQSASLDSIDASTDDIAMRRSMRNSVDVGSVVSPRPYADRRSKGYTFSSPWDGRCEFSTGATGNSLKCKHHLPHPPGHAAEISELRFNLPTSSSKVANAPLVDQPSSYMSGLRRRLHSSSEDGSVDFVFDDDGHIDLTLGREKAGGGFGGKQAKLGKLIIQPEGLAMLDLLVAANVGLWWRAWAR